MTADPEQAARNFYNARGGSYPAVQAATEPAAAAAPVATPVAPAEPVTPPGPAPVRTADAMAEALEERAAALYAPAPTRGLVDWNEPPAQPAEYQFQAPPGVLDTSDAGRAALDRLRQGLAEAGAGRTLAKELFSDAVRAQQEGRRPMSRDAAEAELRQQFGARYEAKVAAARDLVQRAARRCPEIVPFLERTGLGNSPEFVRKLAAVAGRRR